MKTKKNEKLMEEIEIPSGVSARIENKTLVIQKGSEESKRKINPKMKIIVEGNKVIITSDRATKKEKKIFGSMKAHVRNMIKGLGEKFIYKLQVASVHFPMTLTYDKPTNELVVKNFLGEKKDRRIKLVSDIDVKINKDIIEIQSHDIEKAGQAATNIEKGTKVRKRDRRIFQDGIFIIEKPGRSYL
jgi:large subunit ribosomal protein L6